MANFYRGRTEAALIQGREAARYGRPHDVETLMTRAFAYAVGEHFRLGNEAKRSPTLYRQVLKVDPVNQEAQWRLVLATWGVQNEECIEAANNYFRRFGDDPEIHMYVGFAHHLLGRYEGARAHYEKATGLGMPQEATPTFAPERTLDAVLFGGLLYEQLGEPDRAIETWRRGVDVVKPKLEAFPDNVRLRLLSASFYGLLGERGSMLAEEERALNAADSSPWDIHHLAAVRAKMGDTERAIELLRLSLRRGLVLRSWERFFQMAGVPLPVESEVFLKFVKDFEAEERRLVETY